MSVKKSVKLVRKSVKRWAKKSATAKSVRADKELLLFNAKVVQPKPFCFGFRLDFGLLVWQSHGVGSQVLSKTDYDNHKFSNCYNWQISLRLFNSKKNSHCGPSCKKTCGGFFFTKYMVLNIMDNVHNKQLELMPYFVLLFAWWKTEVNFLLKPWYKWKCW